MPLISQLFVSLPYPKGDFTGQTIIVTGANTGLGLEAARHFVRLGAARVVLAVRSISRGEVAKKSIEETEKRTGVVEVWQLDLTSYASVKAFAHRATNELDKLDCVVENAGIALGDYRTAEDNEMTITVNVVSTFLLAILLLQKLRDTAESNPSGPRPRLCIVGSGVHAYTDLPERNSVNILEAASENSEEAIGRRYTVSKLMDLLLMRELATRVSASASSSLTSGTDVVVNCVNPGFCKTELAREAPLRIWLRLAIMRAIMGRTSEVGSRTLVHAAESGQETHGKYLSDCNVQDPSPFVLSEEGAKAQRRLWDELLAKLEPNSRVLHCEMEERMRDWRNTTL